MARSSGSAVLLSSATELPLPLLWLEDSMVHGTFDEAFNQSRYRILSSGRFLAAIGIYNLPIFAIATEGSKAHLLCGWATKSVSNPEVKMPSHACSCQSNIHP